VDVKNLTDVVGMIPFRRSGWERGAPDAGEFFLIEKMNLMTCKNDDDNDEDDDNT